MEDSIYKRCLENDLVLVVAHNDQEQLKHLRFLLRLSDFLALRAGTRRGCASGPWDGGWRQVGLGVMARKWGSDVMVVELVSGRWGADTRSLQADMKMESARQRWVSKSAVVRQTQFRGNGSREKV